MPSILSAGLLMLLSPGVSASVAEPAPAPADCSFMDEAGEPVRSILKRLTGPEVPIVIPKFYFGGPFVYPKDGQPGQDGTLLLYMHRANPMPYPIPQMKGKLERGIQDWISVLAFDFISIEVSAAATLSVYTRSTRNGETLDTPRYDYGLYRYAIPEDLNDSKIDLYFAGDPDRKTDVIHCGRVGPYGKTNPQCEQTTVLHGIKTIYTYNRRYLHDWQNMKANVARLIYCITNPKDI